VSEQLKQATEELLKSVNLISKRASEEKKNGEISIVPYEIDAEFNTP